MQSVKLIIFVIVLYVLIILFVLKLINHFRLKFMPLPSLKIIKSGIEFFSTSKHRIQIDNAKAIQLNNSIYLSKDGKQIIIKNAKLLFIKDGYLYFKAQGKVQIFINLGVVYKYLNLLFFSPNFNLTKLKQNAIKSIVNFPFKKSEDLKRYLLFIKNILKIDITKNQIKIAQNKYKLKYVLIYKNNGYKKIYVNKTL